MKCLMQQLRATPEVWEENDKVVPEGTIALVNENGDFSIKIGDGERPFSALPYVGAKIKYATDKNVQLSRGDDVRFQTAKSISLSFREPIEEDFYATLSFDAPQTGTSFSYPDNIRFTGASCYSGLFYPEWNIHYTLIFWYDGAMQCTVRGDYYG